MIVQTSRKSLTVILLFFFGSGILSAETASSTSTAKSDRIICDAAFSTPESVEYYAIEDVYLVTNINGNPLAADDNGFISMIKPDCSVVDLKWIDGTKKDVTLNAPKGAAIVSNKLFVADLNQVHVFDLPNGKQNESITIRESTFLNGITPGTGNFVYVTDSGFKEGFAPSGTDAIYKVWPDGKYELVVRDKNMGHPNGILDDIERLIVVTFGSGKIISIDAAGKQTVMPSPPKGKLDGLLKLKDGRLVVSSWGGSAVYVLEENNKWNVLADSLDSPADIGFDTKRDRLLVPLFKKNKVAIVPVHTKQQDLPNQRRY